MPCQQNPQLELSLSRRVVIFLIGVIESMLFGGAVFGWPQLVHVLKVEGVFRDLCTEVPSTLNHTRRPPSAADTFNNTRCQGLNTTFQISDSKAIGVETCDPQDERFALIYTITVCCYSIPGVLVGFLLHHAGLRVTRISGGTMLSLGFLFLGIATKENPYWLFPAMILLALGGNQTRMSVMQFGDLFPDYRATAITLLSGMYAASAALFLIFQYTAMAGIPRAYVCWFLAGISTLSIFLSFIMPIHHIPVGNQNSPNRNEMESPSPLSTSLWSGSSFLHQMWFFLTLLSINNYQQSYNVWVSRSSCSVSEAGLYSMLFSYSNLLTVFFGPIGGAFTDFMIRKANTTPNELDRRVKEIQASFWPLLVTTISTMGMYACLLFYHPAAIYVSLLCMVVARPCIIAVSTAYLRIRFPAGHFNRLLGIYGTVASALLFLQYPHFMWAQHMYYAAHALILALLAVSFMNPIHLLFTPLMRHAVIIRDQLKPEDLRPVKNGANAL